jgi:hypothetical protein
MKAFLTFPALFISTVAATQPVDSRIARGDEFANGQVSDSRETRLIGARYGQCVVKKQPAAASAFVLSQGVDMDRGAYLRVLNKVSDGPCLVDAAKSFGGVQMRFPSDTMRYTLADGLFRAQPGTGPLVIPATLPTLAHPTFKEAEYRAAMAKERNQKKQAELTYRRSQSIARIFMSAFGECVVRFDPANSRALLSADVLTPQEDAAFTALRPAFAQCLDAGQNLSMNKAILRGTIALNHYRLAQAVRQGQ